MTEVDINVIFSNLRSKNDIKRKKLTKGNIFKKFIGDSELLSYLRDNVSLAYVSIKFLLSILFYGNKDKYLDLYQQYKETEIQKSPLVIENLLQ